MYFTPHRYTGRKPRRLLWLAALIPILLCAAAVAFFAFRGAPPGPQSYKPYPLAFKARMAATAASRSEKAAQAAQAEPVPAPPAVKVRGLYVTAYSAGIPQRMDHYIRLCDDTEINALVIDIKDDRGQITFIPEDRAAFAAGVNIIPDIGTVMTLLKDHSIYSIARIVCFKDPAHSAENPDLAIKTESGGLWKDNDGNTWLDPYNTQAWDYILQVARLAVGLGFDEIQLDYVRFPTDGKISDINYGGIAATQTKAQAIDAFVAFMRQELARAGCRLSADIFGIAGVNKGDVDNLGQDFELLLSSADSLCPMVYPSHYANKRQNGVGQIVNGVLFEAPDLEPYAVVYNTLLRMAARMPQDGEAAAVIRPYLQDFTASYLGKGYYQGYSAEQVRQQIQAVYDAGFDEWILWNHSGNYSEEALDNE